MFKAKIFRACIRTFDLSTGPPNATDDLCRAPLSTQDERAVHACAVGTSPARLHKQPSQVRAQRFPGGLHSDPRSVDGLIEIAINHETGHYIPWPWNRPPAELVVPVSASYCAAEPLPLVADLAAPEEARDSVLAAPEEARDAVEELPPPKRADAKSSLPAAVAVRADDGGGGGPSFRPAPSTPRVPPPPGTAPPPSSGDLPPNRPRSSSMAAGGGTVVPLSPNSLLPTLCLFVVPPRTQR